MKIVSKRHPDRKPKPNAITAIAHTDIRVSVLNHSGGFQVLMAWVQEGPEDFKLIVRGLKP